MSPMNFPGVHTIHSYMYQELRKGVLAKGVSVESSVTATETKKYPKILAPAVHLELRAPQPREAYIMEHLWCMSSFPEPLSSKLRWAKTRV